MAALDGFHLGATINGTVIVYCDGCGAEIAEDYNLSLGEVAVSASQHACPAREGV